MSLTETSEEVVPLKPGKRSFNETELEIDVNAPEPPSKKALRKAKRTKTTTEDSKTKPATEKKVSDAETGGEVASTKPSPYGIWIGNLSFATTKEDITNFLVTKSQNSIAEQSISRINLPLGPPKFGEVQNKGFAYVDFEDESSFRAAIGLTESLVGGRRLLIKDAKSYEGRPQAESTKTNMSGRAPSKRIFVGNLSFDVTIEDLEKHFEVCGTMSNTHMATFEDSGKCKGFAWIEFEELASAESAMKGFAKGRDHRKRSSSLHYLQGRKLRLEYAEDKTTRYNKRFGKDAKSVKDEHLQGADSTAAGEWATEVSSKPDGDDTSVKRARDRQPLKANKKRSKSGYDAETVKKLTGGIVEGAGQKVMFD